jgi:hypothetical protein
MERNVRLRNGFSGAGLACLAGGIALACLGGAGCGPSAHARLWADTAMPDGGFSLQKQQWAYDGEPVTFELECDPGLVSYVVFSTRKGEETVVNVTKVEGRYRWTHVFRAGPQPQVYEVFAAPYLIRGRCDWIYDKNEDKWYFYPGITEKPDLATDREQAMKITCYQVEVRLRFAARGGPPKRAALSLVTADGRRTEVPQREAAASDGRGFLVLGPDAAGFCEATYVPRYDEVGRAGKTQVELVVEHADGSLERLRQTIDTP